MTARLVTLGCWLWDRFPRLQWLVAYAALFAVVLGDRRVGGIVLGAAPLVLLGFFGAGRWASTRCSSRHMVVTLAPELRRVIDDLAAEQGCSPREVVERSVALSFYVWEHRDDPLGELLAQRLGTIQGGPVGEGLVHLTAVGDHALTGFDVEIGNQRVHFGVAEARELVERWPGRLGVEAVDQAPDGGRERFKFVIGGESLVLSAAEARNLAGLPSQLRRVFAIADAMTASPPNGERVG